MKPLIARSLLGLFFIATALLTPTSLTYAQSKIDRIERERLASMLKNLKGAIAKDYYDPTYHGIDLDARVAKAQERLKEVQTTGEGLAVIAQVLIDFNDSHLFFRPPATNIRVEYGWRARMIGDKCFITTVKPKSDADAKGLKAGDQVLAIEGYKPSRKELWKMMYYYNVLGRRSQLRITALAPGSDQPRELNIESKIRQMPHVVTAENFFWAMDDFVEGNNNDKHGFKKLGNITIWRMPSFGFDPSSVDTLMGENVGTTGSLILDLRSNGGGYIKTLERLTGFFFDNDIKLADLKGRKPMDPILAKSRGKGVFTGKVIVLLSSESGSASEIFARFIQIEKRGIVLGDVSAGAVMQAMAFHGESSSGFASIFYGANITNADVIMSDGKSLEHVGVIPDEIILPTGDDLAKGRDTVLARAVSILGGQMSPEDAGKLFQYDWETK
ncbi:MAG: S41 family peptidase [Pyrinomonadaceae bacterium]